MRDRLTLSARFACALAAVLAPVLAAAEDPPCVLVSPWPSVSYDRPLCLVSDGTTRLYVIEQPGRITWIDRTKADALPTLFFDHSDQVNSQGNEEGMLAMAFHPKFHDNHFVYVYYCVNPPRRTRLARFTVGADGTLDAKTEVVLFEIDKPWANHNGGTLLFGKDGYLYSSCGDGGSGGDPYKNGQNLGTLLGKILRIDVDHEEGGKHYAIPKDNPFVENHDARGEIWAYGLRNVWRMSFDRQTNELWAGDVGQDLFEEVDVIVKGGNYGWSLREGAHPFKDGAKLPGMIDPVVDYPHGVGHSVTGGYVYRGKRIPALVGTYVYADYTSGMIWGLTRDADGKLATNRFLAKAKSITSFGEDDEGELYLTSFDHHLYRFEPHP
jgi:glucose/arabinose dehydrogenase